MKSSSPVLAALLVANAGASPPMELASTLRPGLFPRALDTREPDRGGGWSGIAEVLREAVVGVTGRVAAEQHESGESFDSHFLVRLERTDPEAEEERRYRLVSLRPEGADGLEEVLRDVFPDREPRETGTWALVRALRDAEFQEALRRLSGLSRRSLFLVTVKVDDLHTTLVPSERLELPEGQGDPVKVLPGEDLADVARRVGVPLRELDEANPRRFGLRAHVRGAELELPFPAFFRGLGTVPTREIRMGESRLREDGDFEDFLPVLLHEAGHVADRSDCEGADRGYGPDGAHRAAEIMHPRAAWKEGWGDYLAARLPGRMRELAEGPPEVLEFEDLSGTYHRLGPGELTPGDRLANEIHVAAILRDLDGLEPGPEGVEAAFLATQGSPCRTVVTLLATYVAAFPGERVRVRGILDRRTGGDLSHSELEDALDTGWLPRGWVPDEPPRSRVPVEVEILAGRIQALASGWFGGEEPAPAGALGQ